MIRAARIGATIGLGALAILGLAGAIIWVLAQFGVVQPLIVVSESMRPALRAGDLILTVSVPVEELVPGDVVSVARDEEARFVTHRVVETRREPRGDWTLVLKGDANPIADPAPYSVGDRALKVVWTSPLRLPLARPDVVGAARASWADVVHAFLPLATPMPGPEPYAIATSTEWDRISGVSGAVCPPGTEIEHEWAPAGQWISLDGGGSSDAIQAVFGWDQRVELHAFARCHADGRVSDWVPATNNGVAHGIRRPYASGLSGYTDAATRRFEAHFECPAGTTASTVRIGLRRDGSSPTTALWTAPGSHLVVNWSGAMGNGSVAMDVACTGPWGVVTGFNSHEFGPGCVPNLLVAICTDYYLG